MYTIELQGISVPIMEQILEYIFTGEVSEPSRLEGLCILVWLAW